HAFGLDMGRLGDADHVADADLLRPPGKLEASGATSTRGYEAAAHEDRHDLRHVELRDAVLGRDIGSLDVLAAGERAMDQNPEGVAGLLGQSHGSISEGPNYTRSRACQWLQSRWLHKTPGPWNGSPQPPALQGAGIAFGQGQAETGVWWGSRRGRRADGPAG